MLNKRKLITGFFLIYIIMLPPVLSFIIPRISNLTIEQNIKLKESQFLLVATRAKNKSLDTYLVQNYTFIENKSRIIIPSIIFPNISHIEFLELRIILDAVNLHQDITSFYLKITSLSNDSGEIEAYLIAGFALNEYWFVKGKILSKTQLKMNITKVFRFSASQRIYIDSSDYFAITFRFKSKNLFLGLCKIYLLFRRSIVVMPREILIQIIAIVVSFINLCMFYIFYKSFFL